VSLRELLSGFIYDTYDSWKANEPEWQTRTPYKPCPPRGVHYWCLIGMRVPLYQCVRCGARTETSKMGEHPPDGVRCASASER
jgi:hypothetical protein